MVWVSILELWRKITSILIIIIIIMYVSINFFSQLPYFLVFENIIYSILYVIAFYYVYFNSCPVPALVLSTFNLGRLSRSIISATGTIPKLAIFHLPLFLVILVVMILSWYGLLHTRH